MLPLPEVLVTAQGDGAALSNTTTPTSILPTAARAVIAANTLDRIGKRLRIVATGRISTVVTTPGTLTLDWKIGSVIVASSGAMTLNTTAQTNVNWRLEWDLTLRAVGTSTSANFMHQGTWTSHAVVGSSAIGTAGAGTQMIPYNAAPAVGTGFDSTAAAITDLFATWSVANASNSITLHQYDVLLLN